METVGKKRRTWLPKVALAAAAVTGLTYACVSGANSAADECRSLASDLFSSRDAQYTEVTFADGDFIKGAVMQIREGNHSPVHYWECSYESGEPVITFESPAAG